MSSIEITLPDLKPNDFLWSTRFIFILPRNLRRTIERHCGLVFPIRSPAEDMTCVQIFRKYVQRDNGISEIERVLLLHAIDERSAYLTYLQLHGFGLGEGAAARAV